MRVAVTGAAGLLGRSITRYLAERGLELRALIRSEAQGRALKVDRLVSIVTADILSTSRLVSAFMGCDAVVHCAARVQPRGPAREFYVANVLGTKAVLEACREARVPRLVHISSQGVYDLDDARDGELIDETSATESRPERRGAYSRTKLAAEHLLRRMSSTSPTPHVVILRPGALYGPDHVLGPGPLGTWLPHSGWGVAVGRLDTHLNFTHVDNVAEAVRLALCGDVPTGSTFNVVDDEDLTQEKYMRMLGQHILLVNPAWMRAAFWLAWAIGPGRFRHAVDPVRVAHATRNVAYSTQAARQRLGWSPVRAFAVKSALGDSATSQRSVRSVPDSRPENP